MVVSLVAKVGDPMRGSDKMIWNHVANGMTSSEMYRSDRTMAL